jgi:DNA polymerase alpha-associated DNA helicase A
MDRAMETLEGILLPDSVSDAYQEGCTPAHASQGRKISSHRGITGLMRVLVNLAPPSTPVPLPDLQFLDSSLNPSQKSAVRFALEAAEVACIHGPPGTGKTHTLVEIIRQLVSRGKRILVCGASNLAVDNILERLVQHGIPLTRIGHPARVLSSLLASTLDSQAVRSDQFALAKDVRNELDGLMASLTGKGKGKLRGLERRKMWDEVKELRKECVLNQISLDFAASPSSDTGSVKEVS